MSAPETFLDTARRVIDVEMRGLAALSTALDGSFAEAIDLILKAKGRVIVSGMGKSGHVGRKIAATFASTGTPAQYVHPAEASHGDLGMVTTQDVVLMISNSGESQEISAILPVLKRLGVPLLAMTGQPQSSLAHHADVVLDTSVALVMLAVAYQLLQG